MSRSSDVFESLPSTSSEYEYHKALCVILAGIDFDATDVNVGCGLLSFLDAYDFRGAGIDTTIHAAAGSREEDAKLVAHVFEKVLHDACWWKQEALERAGDETVIKLREWWRQQFANSRLVENVF